MASLPSAGRTSAPRHLDPAVTYVSPNPHVYVVHYVDRTAIPPVASLAEVVRPQPGQARSEGSVHDETAG